MTDLKRSLSEITSLINQKMDYLLPKENQYDETKLVEAMRYSALSDGKRIRPFLTVSIADMFKVDRQCSLNVAVAIEFIHVYSLIHDDLPSMDDDDYRRGRLSCHKRFDEATAILAGDSLLTYAFQILSDKLTHRNSAIRCEIINVVSRAIGFNGMAGGQMMDLEKIGQKLNQQQIARLQRLKTGEMFMASVEAGAILGHAPPQVRSALNRYAHDIGLAFQIRDDILDHAGIEVGKLDIDENANNRKKGETSIVDVIGLQESVAQLKLLRNQAIEYLEDFGNEAMLLRELADFIIMRNR